MKDPATIFYGLLCTLFGLAMGLYAYSAPKPNPQPLYRFAITNPQGVTVVTGATTGSVVMDSAELGWKVEVER